MKYTLVYQAGIANVFKVDCFNLASFGRNAKRLLQSDFRTCEAFARGIIAGNPRARLVTLACNMAGDIADRKWTDDLNGAPFSDNFHPVYSKGVASTDNRNNH